MSKYYVNNNHNSSSGFNNKPKKRIGIVLLKVACWVVSILFVLCGATFWVLHEYLKPDRIKKLIEEKADEYLLADLYIGNLDYKLFSTYPWLEFEIDTLKVTSRSLSPLTSEEKTSLPTNADELADILKVRGKINIKSLLHKKINLKDIEISNPTVNIVIVNDSVNNYNIAPNMGHISKVPKIDLSEIRIEPPFDFNFYSFPQDINGNVTVDSFYILKKDKKLFNVGFEGDIAGKYKDYELPERLPVKFNANLQPVMSEMNVVLKDFSVSMAGLALEAKGDVIAGKKGIDLNNASLRLRIDDIFSLIRYLPEALKSYVELPVGLSGILPLDLSVNLPVSYHIDPAALDKFSMDKLPLFSSTLNINDADLLFIPPKGKKIRINDLSIEVLGDYNPEDPQATKLIINRLRMNGEGITLAGNAEIDNLLGDTQSFKGNLNFGSSLIESLSYLMPKSAMKIAGHLKGKVNFSGEVLGLGKEGLKDLTVDGEIKSSNLAVSTKSVFKVGLKNLDSEFRASIPQYPLNNNYTGTRLGLTLKADTVKANGNGMNLSLADILLKFDASDTVTGTPDPFGSILVDTKTIRLKQGDTSFTGKDLAINAKGSLKSSSSFSGGSNNTPTSPVSPNDSIIESRIQHTPIWLSYQGGGLIQTVMNLINLSADINLEKGYFHTPEYLYPVDVSGLALTTDLNKLNINVNDVKLSDTEFNISAELNGLTPFLTSYSPTPISADADINFKNVDINQLSWGYYGSLIKQNKDSVFYIPPAKPYTRADSLCVVIPRNITANVRLKADSARYMQYAFSPLSTVITVGNGDATLGNLTIGAPYCNVVVDWTYSTRRLDDIFMNLKAKVNNFRFTPFYGVFPSLIVKAPELKNLTGDINADINCNFQMFPDMFMDAESLKGDFNIKGTSLQFARKGKIERITHLLLIEGDQPIKIDNLNLRGTYHDNLLQINPFKIGFDGYMLEFAGVNNSAGDMYYHIALEKSPFHLPFGASLFGNFRHPQFRLGGTHIDDYRSEMVSSDVNSKIDINIMSWLHRGWLMFIQEAAKYEETLNELSN